METAAIASTNLTAAAMDTQTPSADAFVAQDDLIAFDEDGYLSPAEDSPVYFVQEDIISTDIPDIDRESMKGIPIIKIPSGIPSIVILSAEPPSSRNIQPTVTDNQGRQQTNATAPAAEQRPAQAESEASAPNPQPLSEIVNLSNTTRVPGSMHWVPRIGWSGAMLPPRYMPPISEEALERAERLTGGPQSRLIDEEAGWILLEETDLVSPGDWDDHEELYLFEADGSPRDENGIDWGRQDWVVEVYYPVGGLDQPREFSGYDFGGAPGAIIDETWSLDPMEALHDPWVPLDDGTLGPSEDHTSGFCGAQRRRRRSHAFTIWED